MKLWTLLITGSDYESYDNTFVDVYAHPPSIEEIFNSLNESDYVCCLGASKEDIQPMLDGPHRLINSGQWSMKYSLELKEIERRI